MHWPNRFTTEQLVAFYSSLIAVRRLDDTRRREFLDTIAAIADGQFDGNVERRFISVIYTGQRGS